MSRLVSSSRSTSGIGMAIALAINLTPVAASGQPAPDPCATEEHRQFDFWLGTWEVRNVEGRVVGTNRISSILDGCVLMEEWESTGPFAGKSFNIYDAASDRWHQTWVDNGGLLLELNGKLEGGNMVLEGRRPGPGGSSVLHRITWKPLEGGDVRQTWDTSSDDGKSWATQFDGVYSRNE